MTTPHDRTRCDAHRAAPDGTQAVAAHAAGRNRRARTAWRSRPVRLMARSIRGPDRGLRGPGRTTGATGVQPPVLSELARWGADRLSLPDDLAEIPAADRHS